MSEPIVNYLASCSYNYRLGIICAGSVIMQLCTNLQLQIAYFGLCLPGFIAQFLPFMQKFKIQSVSTHVLCQALTYVPTNLASHTLLHPLRERGSGEI